MCGANGAATSGNDLGAGYKQKWLLLDPMATGCHCDACDLGTWLHLYTTADLLFHISLVKQAQVAPNDLGIQSATEVHLRCLISHQRSYL